MNITRRDIRSLLLFAAAAVAVYFGNVQLQSHMGRKALHNTGLNPVSLQEAVPLAQAEARPILANMSAIWCSSCRTLDTQVFADTRVRQLIGAEFVYARIEYETDEGEAFRKRMGVSGFPVLFVLDEEGEAVGRLPITLDPTRFAENLRRAAAAYASHRKPVPDST